MAGTLFLVATPIGNLQDITLRALETLKSVDFVICEDTRHSRGLLSHFGINRPLVSMPAFDEGQRVDELVERLQTQTAALVTDAGTPAISDPGEKLVAASIARGVSVVPIPGASAVVAALSASGLPTGRFQFVGFLPRKPGDREELLGELSALRATLIFYESPRRLAETLLDLERGLGPRRACVARELTKVHEELVRGTLGELAQRYAQSEPLGEITLLVEGRTAVERWSEERVRAALEARLGQGASLKSASGEIAEAAGWRARDVYRLALDARGR